MQSTTFILAHHSSRVDFMHGTGEIPTDIQAASVLIQLKWNYGEIRGARDKRCVGRESGRFIILSLEKSRNDMTFTKYTDRWLTERDRIEDAAVARTKYILFQR
jgi:hypothetical protein